jgi:hypothetical protein
LALALALVEAFFFFGLAFDFVEDLALDLVEAFFFFLTTFFFFGLGFDFVEA